MTCSRRRRTGPVLWVLSYSLSSAAPPHGGSHCAHAWFMDPRWQPHLGPVQPTQVTPEACDLLADGWHAEVDECRIGKAGDDSRMVSLETWRSLRDRSGFVRPRLLSQGR